MAIEPKAVSIENKIIKDAGLKVTLPRLKIFRMLQRTENQHKSAEELYQTLINQGNEVGIATVYRVLNQFDDAGIVTRHHFEGGKSVFELTNQDHHDHLVCLKCDKVIEFNDEMIEKHQKLIAEKFGMKLTNHCLFLYGEPIDEHCNH
ncbi:MAG TPA: ferric iron uptake transcriptional regulator [Psychromonas hadalis]|nr:ferric iron uptake transcriptional regulator [Psychromonas hadalis]